MTLKLLRHVLFDLDGTLVDSREAVTRCYARVFREHLQSDFPPPGLDPSEIYAMRPAEVFGRVAPSRSAELESAYQEGYRAASASLKVFDGASRLIEGLAAAGRRPSLVTNKGRPRTLIDLDHAGIDLNWFSAIVTAEDTVERKPHPAPLRLGLLRAGATSADAVYVGDGPQDILAARAAGMPAIAVTYGFYSRSELESFQPNAWADSIEELAELLGVPLDDGKRR